MCIGNAVDLYKADSMFCLNLGCVIGCLFEGGGAVSPATTGWKTEESLFDAPQALKISDRLRANPPSVYFNGCQVPGVKRLDREA